MLIINHLSLGMHIKKVRTKYVPFTFYFPFLLPSGMGGDVYLFCARHPLRIDLRRYLFVIAADSMQIVVERFIRVVGQ